MGEQDQEPHVLFPLTIVDISRGFRSYREKHGPQQLQRFILFCVVGKEFQTIDILAPVSDNGANAERWVVEAWRELNLNLAIDGKFDSGIQRGAVIADVAEACVYQ